LSKIEIILHIQQAMVRLIYFFMALVGLLACKTTSQTSLTSQPIRIDSTAKPILVDSVVKERVAEEASKELDSKEAADDLTFSYLKAKSRVAWKSGTNTDNYSVDIRVKKDSLIWVTISSTMMGFRVDYRMLQSLIVGNQPFKKNNSRVIRENENIIIKQDSGRIKIDNMVGPNRKLKKLLVRDEPSSNKLTLDFEEFTNLNQVIFPFSSQITLDVKNKENIRVTTVIQIKYSKVELLDTPLEFPFRIPAKFLKK
jgi:hypothetical protein